MWTPSGSLTILGHDPLGLVDEADDVAAADVQRHIVEQAAVFALDHRRPFDDADVGHGRKRDQAAPALRVAWLGDMRPPPVGGSAAAPVAMPGEAEVIAAGIAIEPEARPATLGLISSRRTASSSSRCDRT